MKRFVNRPRSLLLVAVLAVVTAMCTVSTANAASSASAAPHEPAASSTQCNFVGTLTTCESRDPTVSYTAYAHGDTSHCTFVFDVTWGDGASTTKTFTDPSDGDHLVGDHIYADATAMVYTITVTVQVTAGNCTGTNSVHTFALVKPPPGGWAGSSFCASFPNSKALKGNVPFHGMAACGGSWSGGEVEYNGVVFENAPSGYNTWQCTELAARWFYIDTGLPPPLADDGADVVSDYTNAANYPEFTAHPASGGTSKFDSSIKAGDIISMWGGADSDSAGHVAVVTAVNVTGGTGTISLIEENGALSGNFYITVNNGQMYYYGSPKNGKYYYTSFQWMALPST